MDPQVTWRKLLEAYGSRDWSIVEQSAEALLSWLAGGGFPPRLDSLDAPDTAVIVQLVCCQVLTSIPQTDR